jgi:hypothetical protein
MRRLGAFGLLVAVPSWLALLLGGNVGLQRSITGGAWTLLFERPAVGLGAIAIAFATAFAAWPLVRGRSPLAAAFAVTGWNLVAGLLLAPLAIGELEPAMAGLVLGATTVCGLTVLAAWLGAWLRAGLDGRAGGRRPGA